MQAGRVHYDGLAPVNIYGHACFPPCDEDDLLAAEAAYQLEQESVEWHLSAGLGHGIDAEGLRHGGEFLARRLTALPQGL